MRRITRSIALAGAALVAAVGLTVSSASATSMAGFAVSPGGDFDGDAVGPTFTTPSAQLICDTSHADGTLETSSTDGVGIGDITNIEWTNCLFFGIPFTVTTNATMDNPWKVNVTGPHPSVPNAFSGTISGIQAHISAPGVCEADISSPTQGDATVPGYYVNPTATEPGHLVITPGGNLTVHNVVGCFGAIVDDEHGDYDADYTVSPNQTITAVP